MRCNGFGRNGSQNSDGKSALIGDADAVGVIRRGNSEHHGVLATFWIGVRAFEVLDLSYQGGCPTYTQQQQCSGQTKCLFEVTLTRAEAVRLHVEAERWGRRWGLRRRRRNEAGGGAHCYPF